MLLALLHTLVSVQRLVQPRHQERRTARLALWYLAPEGGLNAVNSPSIRCRYSERERLGYYYGGQVRNGRLTHSYCNKILMLHAGFLGMFPYKILGAISSRNSHQYLGEKVVLVPKLVTIQILQW